MKKDKSISRILILNSIVENVWDTLTNPEKTKLYIFNCEAHSDWEIGSEIKWKGNFNGYESGEKGIILKIVKNKLLKYSSIDPNFGIEDIPKNYLHITYSLIEIGGKTKLKIVIENFNDDSDRIQHIAKGWDTIVIPALKKIHKSN